MCFGDFALCYRESYNQQGFEDRRWPGRELQAQLVPLSLATGQGKVLKLSPLQLTPGSVPNAPLCAAAGEDFVDIPEDFFGVGGEEDITIQTVTWPDVELPLPRNITEGEARGNVILTAKPFFGASTTVSEPEEPFTFVPETGATGVPEAENETGESTGPWDSIPSSSTTFTSEDLVVQVTVAPGAAGVPGQPSLPGGKCLPLAGDWGGVLGEDLCLCHACKGRRGWRTEALCLRTVLRLLCASAEWSHLELAALDVEEGLKTPAFQPTLSQSGPMAQASLPLCLSVRPWTQTGF